MKPLRIVVDRETCAACDVCCEIAPDTFEIDEEAKARVKNPEGNPRDVIIQAADNCPMVAITVEDGDTGEKLVPAG